MKTHYIIPLMSALLGLIVWLGVHAFNRPQTEVVTAFSPLHFELNEGKADQHTQFLAQSHGSALLLKADEAVLRASDETLRMRLRGANTQALPIALDKLPGKVHRLRGNDARAWRTNIATFARVKFQNVYRGIDVVWYGSDGQLEYDFVIAPGSDARPITLEWDGVEKIALDEGGNLLLHTRAGVRRQRKPVIYQEANGARQKIAGRYVMLDAKTVTFELGVYDATRPVVIDPILELSYATYLGGRRDEGAGGIAVDADGFVYVTGLTESLDFPTKNPLQPSSGGDHDVFVAKFNHHSGELLYATYLGGNASDQALAIAADATGNAYVTGQTCSNNFPVRNAIQPNFGGLCDGFVVKLNAAGSALVYSTYLGGRNNDPSFDIAVDSENNAVVTGWTNSPDFPVQRALQPQLADASGDAFITKLNAAGSALVFSTFLGGRMQFDRATSVAVDVSNQIYVTGGTQSSDFPTRNAWQANLRGSRDGFVAKLNGAGSALIFSTFLGGALSDEGRGIATDRMGNALVTGITSSTDFPTRNPLQAAKAGEQFVTDAFVTKLDALGTELVYSTYLGGSGSENDEYGGSIAVDAFNSATVSGSTNSADFPLKHPLHGYGGRGDMFIAKLRPSGAAFDYSTYLGGSDTDFEFSQGLALQPSGIAYVNVATQSQQLPTTPTAFQKASGGFYDAYVARIVPVVTNVTAVSAASYRGATLASQSIVAAFGSDLGVTTQSAATTPLPTTLGGTTVRVKDSAGIERLAPLLFVSPRQVNFIMPTAASLGAATITVTEGDGISTTGTVQAVAVAPGLFAANANGQGVAAALVLRIKPDNTVSYEDVARYDVALRQYVALPINLSATNEQVFLVLFGTGLRFRRSLSNVAATIGGESVEVLYAGEQITYEGLDQINLRLPRSLSGRGLATVALTVEGQTANPVTISIQ